MIFHLALRTDWEAAQAAGSYRISTLGRTLAEEGFIHTSYAEQVEGVARRFYQGQTDLVLLSIDESRLGSPVIAEAPAPGVSELFPHIYGPIDLDAVVGVEPYEVPAA